jgi:hypothetical protein
VLVATGASGAIAQPVGALSGPDGHWLNLFPGWPVNVTGKTVYDPVRDRMLLFGPEFWELPFSDPLTWRRLPTPLGSYPGTYLFVYDLNADRILAVVPRPYPDWIHVHQLTLSEPMTWSELPTMNSPALNWYPEGATFDPATNTIQIFGGSWPDPFGGPTLIVEWLSNISVATGTAVFSNYGNGRIPSGTFSARIVTSVPSS